MMTASDKTTRKDQMEEFQYQQGEDRGERKGDHINIQ